MSETACHDLASVFALDWEILWPREIGRISSGFERHRGVPQRGGRAARREFGAGVGGRERPGRAAEDFGDVAGDGAAVGKVELDPLRQQRVRVGITVGDRREAARPY